MHKIYPLILGTIIAVFLVATGCNRSGESLHAVPTSLSVSKMADRSSIIPKVGTIDGLDGAGIFATGTGTVMVQPDLAIISIGVKAIEPVAQDALGKANVSLNHAILILDKHGIQESDTGTSFFNIRPIYTEIEVVKCDDGTKRPLRGPKDEPAGETCYKDVDRITNYQVTNQLEVKIRDLDTIGTIIDGVVRAGGDQIQISNINFTLEDIPEYEDMAREIAVLDALDKAHQFANLAQVKLGNLLFISEIEGYMPYLRTSFDSAYSAQGFAETTIRNQSLEITIEVQTVHAIK